MKSILYPVIWVAIMGLGIFFQAISNQEESNEELKEIDQNTISLID